MRVAMATVRFTQNLQRHASAPETRAPGTTVREALDATFRENPKLRGYVLDDQAALRRHMVVFVNGSEITDRSGLSDPVPEDGEIFVMQALSGG